MQKVFISMCIVFLFGGIAGFMVGRTIGQNTTYIGSGENAELAAAYDREYRRHLEDQKQSDQYRKEIKDHLRNIKAVEAERDKWRNYSISLEKNSMSIIISTKESGSAVDRIRDRSLEAIRIIDSLDLGK